MTRVIRGDQGENVLLNREVDPALAERRAHKGRGKDGHHQQMLGLRILRANGWWNE